ASATTPFIPAMETPEFSSSEQESSVPNIPESKAASQCPPVVETGHSDSIVEDSASVAERARDYPENMARKPLIKGRRYDVRPAPIGGYGVYEKGSTVLLQWHAT